MSTYSPEDRTDHPDVAANPIEENVPNSAKVLPSSRNTVLLLSIAAGIAAVLAVVATKGMRSETLALVLALAAVVLGGIAILMARGDARASAITPSIITVMSAIILVVVIMDLAEADDALETGNIPGTTAQPAAPADYAE
jgi:hypothetical protein